VAISHRLGLGSGVRETLGGQLSDGVRVIRRPCLGRMSDWPCEVENYSDLIAELAGGLGSTAYGTVQAAAEHSFLVPYPLGWMNESGVEAK
jgi:hypothetical protein